MGIKRCHTLLEVAIAVAIFGLIALAAFATLAASQRAEAESSRSEAACSAMRDVVARLQEAANQDAAQVHAAWNGVTFTPAPPSGTPSTTQLVSLRGLPGAQLQVTIWKDEADSTGGAAADRMPATPFGGALDLNLDGDTSDVNPGSGLKLLPVRLVLTWKHEVRGGSQTRQLRQYALIGRTAS